MLTEPSAHVGLISTMHRYGVTVVPIVPSLGDMLVRLAARDARPAPPVRMFTNTGAALTGPLIAALRRSFPHAAVYAMFGITECKRVSIAEPDVDLLKPGSCGTPLDGTEVLILDDAGRVQPPGEPGEIVVRGPHVMSGYWRAPDLSRERFRRDPATGRPTLYTGDFGYLDADGHLYFLGRRDDMFKRRGVRLGALEVEAAARDVPGVGDAALLPPTDGHDMVLFAVVEPDSGLDAAGLAHRLGERLEKAKVPADCRLLPELPLTPNGKTDKRRLGTLVPAGQED